MCVQYKVISSQNTVPIYSYCYTIRSLHSVHSPKPRVYNTNVVFERAQYKVIGVSSINCQQVSRLAKEDN